MPLRIFGKLPVQCRCAAMPKISTDRCQAAGGARDRKKTGRESAHALLGGKCQRDAFEPERHRQLRRLRRKRSRGEKDRGADRAIIVVVARSSAPELLRRRRGLEVTEPVATAPEAQAAPPTCTLPTWMCPNDSTICSTSAASPSHAPYRLWNRTHPMDAHANVTMLHLARGTRTRIRAHLECGGERQPHRQRLDRMQRIVHHAVLADRRGRRRRSGVGKHMANRLSVLSSEP